MSGTVLEQSPIHHKYWTSKGCWNGAMPCVCCWTYSNLCFRKVGAYHSKQNLEADHLIHSHTYRSYIYMYININIYQLFHQWYQHNMLTFFDSKSCLPKITHPKPLPTFWTCTGGVESSPVSLERCTWQGNIVKTFSQFGLGYLFSEKNLRIILSQFSQLFKSLYDVKSCLTLIQ